MTFYSEDLTLYSPTKFDTEKIDEIEKNPSVSVLLGYEDKGQSDAYVAISGTATINKSQDLKKRNTGKNHLNNGSTVLKIQILYFFRFNHKCAYININGEPSEELTL